MSSESLGSAMTAGAIEPRTRSIHADTARHAPIRVVDVCNVDSSANTILKQRVLAMREQGIDNRILCVEGPYVRVLEQAGIPIGVVPMPRGFDLLLVARSFLAVYRYFRRERIDLVHTHFSVPGFIGRVAAWLAGVPVIVHTIHGYPYHAKSSAAQRWFYILLERSVGRIAHVVLSQNRDNLADAIRYRMVPRDRLRFIGNGIHLDRFRPPVRRTAPAVPTITCLARHEGVKHHVMLFEAVRRLKDRGIAFRVLLVGGGDERQVNEAHVDRLGIRDRVEFLGYRDDVPEILARTEVSVLTSIKEGVPRAILESMAMAIPVVATRIPGNVDAVRDGETGYLVDVDDVEALADRLAALMADPALRATLGARARQVALQEFDERRIVESLGQLYKSLLLKQGIAPSHAVPRTVTS
jgi:glycosyltransferase involved in cell wall biosynthesis